MLIGFNFGNIYSYKNNTILSLMASKIKELKEENTFNKRDIDLLKNAVIYGKNSSGKSNIFKALGFMKKFILNSNINDSTTPITINNFKLNNTSESLPSFFEVSIIINDIIYIYGFKISNNEIQEEWLNENVKRFKTLFHRKTSDYNSIEIGNSFKEAKNIKKEFVRKNGLFLPLIASYNGEISNEILQWFKNLKIISGDEIYDSETIELSKNDIFKVKIIDFLKTADLDICNFNIEEEEIPEELKKLIENNKLLKNNINDLKMTSIKTVHNKYNDKYESIGTVEFDKNLFESEGTKKYFSLSGPIINSLENGYVLFIDELDSKLHPLMVQYILDKYNSFSNKKNAQLIINTHNTTLLNNKLLRRDQIWFVDKNKYGESELYSLSDYNENKKIRNDESYEKNYLLGKYGAIPRFYYE